MRPPRMILTAGRAAALVALVSDLAERERLYRLISAITGLTDGQVSTRIEQAATVNGMPVTRAAEAVYRDVIRGLPFAQACEALTPRPADEVTT